MEKEITVFICESSDLMKEIISKYVQDTKGKYDGGITYMAKFKAESRPNIVDALDELLK